jgi:hypothetical protein
MLASARPSSFGKAGAEVVSVKLWPRSLERSSFMPKKGSQLEPYRRGVPRVSMSVAYTGTPGPKGPRSVNECLGFAASATKSPFFVPMVSTTFSDMVFSLQKRPAGS